MSTPNIINLKELRVKLTKYAAQVEKDKKSFLVFRKSKPLFKIIPLEEAEWETVIDFTEIAPQGVPLEKLLKSLRSMR